jgi:hypothetical protein
VAFATARTAPSGAYTVDSTYAFRPSSPAGAPMTTQPSPAAGNALTRALIRPSTYGRSSIGYTSIVLSVVRTSSGVASGGG